MCNRVECPSARAFPLRESQRDSAPKPGVAPPAALPRVWVRSAPQPRRWLCRWVEWVVCEVCEVCVFRGSWTYIPGGLLFGTREPDPIPSLFTAPPVGTNGTTPCGVGNGICPEPGVAPPRRNPGLYATTPLALRRGNRKWARMDADGRGSTRTNFPIRKRRRRTGHRRSPSGNPQGRTLPIPLRESQRDSATKPGVAPPRRYPGSMPNISTTLTGLCKRAVHSGQFLGRTFQSRQSSSIPMMVQIRTAHSPASQPWFWAMDPRPLPWTTRPT